MSKHDPDEKTVSPLVWLIPIVAFNPNMIRYVKTNE